MDSSLQPDTDPVLAGAPLAQRQPSALHACLSALCGAGCGLVLWIALSSLLLMRSDGTLAALVDLQSRGLGLGIALAGSGLGLFWPRAATPGRWWGRGLAALFVVLAGAALLALLLRQPQPDPTVLALMAALACAGAVACVCAQGLMEGGDTARRLPARLGLALLGGATLLFALISLRWPDPMPAAGPVPPLALLVVAAAGLVAAQWLPQGGLRPWARARGRWLALGLIAAVPLMLAALLYLQPGWARVLWPLVALSVLAGSALERLQAR